MMPCRNAMPWLPDCVASVLAQTGLEECGGLELIAVDDSSTDGSREWLRECAAALAAADVDADAKEEEEEGAQQRKKKEEEEEAAAAAASAEEEEEERSSGEGDEDGAVCGFPADRLEWEKTRFTPLSIAQVVARRCRGNVLVVRTVDQTLGPSGQGKALNLAYHSARGEHIGEMESDDLRPPRAFATLRAALDANLTWDCATSEVRLVGWNRPGMERWITWQNAQRTPRAMAKARFLEIPALRGSGLYRRAALEAVAASEAEDDDDDEEEDDDDVYYTNDVGKDNKDNNEKHHAKKKKKKKKLLGPYRDLWMVNSRVTDCAHDTDPGYERPGRANLRPSGWWPVDADFWQRWFTAGLTAGKVDKPLYMWRQYPAQSTRTHDRCSLEQLRACKVHFLLARGGVARGRAVQVWGTGETLKAWVNDLRRTLAEWEGAGFIDAVPAAAAARSSGAGDLRKSLTAAAAEATVRGVEYKPGAPVGKKRLQEEDKKSREAMETAGVRFPSPSPSLSDPEVVEDGDGKEGAKKAEKAAAHRPPLRLFAFGMEKARRKVASTFRDFDEEGDDHWFVA